MKKRKNENLKALKENMNGGLVDIEGVYIHEEKFNALAGLKKIAYILNAL